jgi:hypothetical protein
MVHSMAFGTHEITLLMLAIVLGWRLFLPYDYFVDTNPWMKSNSEHLDLVYSISYA